MKLVFYLPIGLFLVFKVITLMIGIIGGFQSNKTERIAKIEKEVETRELDIPELVTAAVATMVAVNLVSQVAEVVDTMPNQLIQKKNKPLITKTILELPIDSALTEERLRKGFEKIQSEKGLGYLSKLETEYKGLKLLLENGRIEETVLNLKRISKLTSSLYQQGLSFLSQALNVAEQLNTSSRDNLLAESEELKTELGRCTPGSTLYNMVTERLASNAKSLSTVKGYSEKLDEYFCQVGLCRDSIREIRLEIPELLGNKPKDEFEKVMLELRTRVELAQRVQAEYTKQGV